MRAAEPDPFNAFAVAHGSELMRLAGALTGDPHFSEDAAQAALERVYLRWRRLDDPLAYARQVVVNLCRDRGRGWSARETVGLPDEGAASTLDRLSAVDDRDRLVRAVRALPHGQRAVVVLRYWHDLTEAQTAAALGVSIGTVKSYANRAIARLRASPALDVTSSTSLAGGTHAE